MTCFADSLTTEKLASVVHSLEQPDDIDACLLYVCSLDHSTHLLAVLVTY